MRVGLARTVYIYIYIYIYIFTAYLVISLPYLQYIHCKYNSGQPCVCVCVFVCVCVLALQAIRLLH